MLASRLFLALPLAALFSPALAFGQSNIQDFKLSGSASVVGKECIRLTPDVPRTSGSAWHEKAIDLKAPFEMKMSLVLGDKDIDGADGIVFVFHPTPTTGFTGEGMGFAGLFPSLGIEFDTYQNFHLNDPYFDHLAVMRNGESYHAGDQAPIELGNIEDGARHPLRIVWNPADGLKIYFDDKLKTSVPAAAVTGVFGGNSTVYWGMTAATGRLANAQDVCIDSVFMGV